MKNSFPIYAIATIMLLICRILLNGNQQLTLIVAIINLIALLVVVFAIVNQIKEKLSVIIKQSNVPREVSTREKKRIFRLVNSLVYFPLLILCILYLLCWCSGLGNDIISIAALGLSLSDSQIAEVIANQYKK